MKKDKYYFEIDGEKVLEVTPTEAPSFKCSKEDICNKFKDTWDMLYRNNVDDTIYTDGPIVPMVVSQELYDYAKELGLLSDDDIIDTYYGVRYKLTVQPELSLPDVEYKFVAEEK